MYLVTENTPGYLPESEPVEFESYPEAHEYALEQARAYTEEDEISARYYITNPPESDQIRVACDDPRTLVRVWEITYDGHGALIPASLKSDEPEIIVGCPGCGGYIFEGDALCGNCKLDPKAVLHHHVTGAIERGEATPIVEIPAAIELFRCAEGDRVIYSEQEWRVGGIRDGKRTLYGITRRTFRDLPGNTLVTPA